MYTSEVNTLHDVVNGIAEGWLRVEIYVFARRVYGSVIEYRRKSIITVPGLPGEIYFPDSAARRTINGGIEKFLIDLDVAWLSME